LGSASRKKAKSMQELLPADAGAHAATSFGRFGRRLLVVCKAAAIAGGLVFVALVVMSIVSIIGRKLISAPVPGDVELLQV
jgi:hypothetical protein